MKTLICSLFILGSWFGLINAQKGEIPLNFLNQDFPVILNGKALPEIHVKDNLKSYSGISHPYHMIGRCFSPPFRPGAQR